MDTNMMPYARSVRMWNNSDQETGARGDLCSQLAVSRGFSSSSESPKESRLLSSNETFSTSIASKCVQW